MTNNTLEHINITVSDPDSLAGLLCRIFGWSIRWSGPAKDEGYTVHVGSESSYLALYTHKDAKRTQQSHTPLKHLNHIGIVVDELSKVEERIKEQGFSTFGYAEYEPGKRFYFMIEDDLEMEVISYQSA